MKRAFMIPLAMACLQALIPVGVFLASNSGRPLAAQAGMGWVSVNFDSRISADIRVKVISTSTGYQLYFKNFGAETVHFGFYLEGVQTPDAVSANGRVHLKKKNILGPLTILPSTGVGGPVQIHTVGAASGEADVPPAPASAS